MDIISVLCNITTCPVSDSSEPIKWKLIAASGKGFVERQSQGGILKTVNSLLSK